MYCSARTSSSAFACSASDAASTAAVPPASRAVKADLAWPCAVAAAATSSFNSPNRASSDETWLAIWSGLEAATAAKIGRAHVCTPVTNAQIVCSLLLDTNKIQYDIHNIL